MHDEHEVVDSVTLMEYQQGRMKEDEIILMCANLVGTNQVIDLPAHYEKLCKKYIREGVIDDEGNVNYIKLKEYA